MKGLGCVYLVWPGGDRAQHVLDGEGEGHMKMRVVMHRSNTPREHALTVPVPSSMIS